MNCLSAWFSCSGCLTWSPSRCFHDPTTDSCVRQSIKVIIIRQRCASRQRNVGTNFGGLRPVNSWHGNGRASLSLVSRISLMVRVWSMLIPTEDQQVSQNVQARKVVCANKSRHNRLTTRCSVQSIEREQIVLLRRYVLSCCCRRCFPWVGRWPYYFLFLISNLYEMTTYRARFCDMPRHSALSRSSENTLRSRWIYNKKGTTIQTG